MQKIADGGSGTIVSQIQNPSSPQQLSAALHFATSQIEVQQANIKYKVKPDPKKLDALSAAVRSATLKNPDNPAVWQAIHRSRSPKRKSSLWKPIGGIPETETSWV
jgi:hypothetical protein